MKHLRSALFSILCLAACAPTSPPPSDTAPDDTAVLIPATTRVTDAATRAALTAYDAQTGVLRFAPGSAVLNTLKAGDVLVSEPSNAAPAGYLRKVQAIRQENGQTVLDTTQANLTDAVTQGELNAEGELTAADMGRAALLPGMTLTAAPRRLTSQAGVGTNYHFQLTFNHTFVPVNGPSARGQLKVDGSVDFNAGYGVNVGIKPCFELPPVCVKNFQASVGLAQSSRLKISGDVQGSVGETVKVGTQYFTPKVFFIGPVPVVIVPKIELLISAGGQLSATFLFEAQENLTAQMGARWTKDGGWKNISGFSIDGSVSPPTFAGSLKPRAGLVLTTSLKLYDVAGPEASLEGGLDIDARIPRSPAWTVKGYLKGTLGFRVTLPIIGTLASYQTTLFDTDKELARAGNTPPTLALTPTPHTVNAGTPLNFWALCTANGPAFGNGEFYTASDAEDGCPKINVVSDRDGPLPPDFTFTATGPRQISVTATDSQGASARLGFVLNVVNPPPTLTLKYIGDPQQGEDYLMSAAVSDSNEPANSNLCNQITWAVDAPDTLSATSGCDIKVRFAVTGARQVRVTTRDRYGAVASQTVTLNVLPPPVNPYPLITASGVYTLGGTFCGEYAVTNGSTLDFRTTTSCTAKTARYTAKATINNPQGEALTYEWKQIVQYQGKDTVFATSTDSALILHGPGGGFNTGDATTPCRVTLTLGAPDPSRSKSLTVWSGLCRYYTFRLA